MEDLEENSSTGPDDLSAKIIQKCAEELAWPVTLLVMRIIACMKWPELWRTHWIIPLYKRNAVFRAKHYRGIHLTAQMSKVVERLVKGMMEPYLERTGAYGLNQFAYRKDRGARDLILLVVLEWLQILDNRGKIAVHCSDVAGAFDRVDSELLAEKLRIAGVHPRLIGLMISWLEKRKAKVLVGGETSDEFELMNQVFQGTVLGPSLWNLFYADAKDPIRAAGFKELMFADDLHSYRGYSGHARNCYIRKQTQKCEAELQKWGAANKVTFEPDKQHMSIISLHEPEGEDFKMMGVWFDPKLTMERAITELCNKLRWKVTTLLRAREIFDTRGLIKQFKARILSYVECRTAAIYHANATALDQIDRQYNRFLREVGLNREEALMVFHLAPLASRRDMAMLGVIHRAVLGKGPEQVRKYFARSDAPKHPEGRQALRRHSK